MTHKVIMVTKKEAVEISRLETAPVFQVSHDREVVGDLTVSQGGVRWRPQWEGDHVFFTWEKFAELMKAQAAKK